jgi:hypothetical protein
VLQMSSPTPLSPAAPAAAETPIPFEDDGPLGLQVRHDSRARGSVQRFQLIGSKRKRAMPKVGSGKGSPLKPLKVHVSRRQQRVREKHGFDLSEFGRDRRVARQKDQAHRELGGDVLFKQCGAKCIVTMENQIGSSCRICISCMTEAGHSLSGQLLRPCSKCRHSICCWHLAFSQQEWNRRKFFDSSMC